MMSAPIFIYALKSSLVLVVLYVFYLVLFQKNTNYGLKRLLLLGLIVLPLTLPLLKLEVNNGSVPDSPVLDQVAAVLPETRESLIDFVPPTRITETTEAANNFELNSSNIILAIYWLGVAVSLSIMLYQLSKLLYLAGFSKARNDLGRFVVYHSLVKYPCSFWKWTFLPKDFNYDDKTSEIVSHHEQAHQVQGHTVDLIFLAMFRSFLWFNPIVYLLQRSVKENHEHLADQSVLKIHSLEEYSKALLAVCLESTTMHMTHSFSLKNNLSKRIKNMNRQKTSHFHTSVSLVLFVCALLLVMTQVSLFSQNSLSEKVEMTPRHIISHNPDGSSFSSVSIYEKTGAYPDAWLFLNKEVFPLILLNKYKAEFDELVEAALTDIRGQLDYEVYLKMGKTGNLDEDVPKYRQGWKRTAKFTLSLTKEELSAMYELTQAWHQDYTKQVYPESQLISKAEFMNYKYLYFVTEPSRIDPRKYGTNHTVDVSEVDEAPEPYEGMNKFLQRVVSRSKQDPKLKVSELPEKIEFEFTIDAGGNLVLLKPLTKELSKEAYRWVGSLNTSMIKISERYLWQPGIKEGKEVPTRMRLEIPRTLF